MLGYHRATWIIIGLWFLFCAATLDYNGPFFDEAVYITAGLRTFEGHGFTDGYFDWFTGFLFFWSVLAAIGYKVAGLVGTRAIALVFATTGFIAVVKAAKNLFDARVGFWTALALAINGPLLALARLGVHDVLAMACIAISFWALTEFDRSNRGLWLAVAAIAFTAGLIAKFPTGLMLLPLLGIILALRKDKALMDITLFGLISLALALAVLLPVRDLLGRALGQLATNRAEFGVTRTMMAFDALYLSGAPIILATVGWFLARDRRRLGYALLLSLAIWPAYHLATGDSGSRSKHLVFGFVFAYPLVGLALSTLWHKARRGNLARRSAFAVSILALTALGLLQMYHLDLAWPDVRETADYLVTRVEPGQKILANDSWPYTMYLYTGGRINAPSDVIDIYSYDAVDMDLCEYDWFINERGLTKWPESVENTIEECGHFQEVYRWEGPVAGVAPNLRYVKYPAYIYIHENTSGSE